MNIVDALLGEHGMLYVQFDYIEPAVSRIEDLTVIKAAGRALAATVQSHLTLEDELLCARVISALKSHPPVIGCEMSHDEIDRGFVQLWAAEDPTTAQGNLLGILALARRHSFGQERVLFPLARRMLTSEVMRVLGAEWAKRRGIVVQPDGPMGQPQMSAVQPKDS